MPELNLSEAARLYGKSRMTLHRHCRSGRITSRLGEGNQRLVDLSELIRAYGEPPSNVTGDTPKVRTARDTPDTPSDTRLLNELMELREEVKTLRREVQELRFLPPPKQEVPLIQEAELSSPLTNGSEEDKQPVTSIEDVLRRWERRR